MTVTHVMENISAKSEVAITLPTRLKGLNSMDRQTDKQRDGWPSLINMAPLQTGQYTTH